MLKEEILGSATIEFQKIKVNRKKEIKENFVIVKKMQTSKVKPENFYKPISKML